MEETKCETCEFYEPDIGRCPEASEKWCKQNDFAGYIRRKEVNIESAN